MSGGQQRRVSLACSLIHCPPLLILDEPTVGTDPVLRLSIWSHLETLSSSGHTIIVTTHYIDEARKAHTVAFMRNGQLVAQENPHVLLKQYGMLNLEDVFLKLCIESDENDNKNDSNPNCVQIKQNNYDNQFCTELTKVYFETQNVDKQDGLETNDMSIKITIKGEGLSSNHTSIKIRSSGFLSKHSALLQKDFKRFSRKWFHLLFGLVCPSLLFIFVMMSIGDGPSNLNLAIFDEEKQNNLSENWGQLFIDSIDKNRFNLHYFKSIEEAIESVSLGNNHVAIDINDRFTKAIILRFNYLTETDEDTLEESTINVYIDQSNQLLALQLEGYLYSAMVTFIQIAANKMKINPEFFKVPLSFDKSINGDSRGSIKDFIPPGLYLICVFYISAVMTSHNIIVERKDGVFQRSVVAGITASDILLSNIIFQMLVQVFQITGLIFIGYFLMNVRFPGPFAIFLAMIFSQGLCGIGLGLVLSILISDELIVILLIVVMEIMSLTLGTFWPFENMPQLIQFASKFYPTTLPIISMRSIMYRGWGIEYFEVYLGFIVNYIWFSVFLIISLIFLKKGI